VALASEVDAAAASSDCNTVRTLLLECLSSVLTVILFLLQEHKICELGSCLQFTKGVHVGNKSLSSTLVVGDVYTSIYYKVYNL
jgi:hypothetical protein